MGRLGLSRADFMVLTPEEFEAVVDAGHKRETEQEHAAWERMRMHAAILLQPHMKKGATISPKHLIRFPWEDETRKEIPEPELTEEQRHERFEKVKKIFNIPN